MADSKYQSTPSEPPPSYEVAASPAAKPSAMPAPLRQPVLRASLPLDLPALNMIGLHNLEIIPSTAPENLHKSLSPFEYVLRTASQKAMNVYSAEINNTAKGEPALIIAADTVVVSQTGQILEKPRSEKEHIATLKGLRDSGWHKVYTAVACMAPLESARDPGYALETHVEETAVKFDPAVTDELILAYVKTREGADKAGGYGIQGIGSILVERIEGTYDNVVGLPLRATQQLIEKVMAPEEDPEEDDEGLIPL
ncbi:hypothetical protein B0A49_02810 [Cryomyces minteri]|uniref:Maf-like protein n=2 Tax=Cryomyces minteri TaxID=331657 RepID=A0A4V5NFD2_9PEZI|nr:hypothetical protein B0A49_02810 [Cryomyces minteri]